ncbi:helix-turn-helix domain-containing protein [Maribacter algarum]|uniref:Helix-turn-helix domain-containing protein n=1 Tax=Maribacter algarum (ex Zhang et al. 2020) TaxID=2578118 RepID=A0A5S3PQ51_9FLAO|nr:helix-turn-helix domain-containing protein [Maribacter algarum]TMM56877.1 helix-turn-helix domain-containing protein [Maribacter algarum]
MRHSKENMEQYHLHKANPEKLQFEVYDLNTYRKSSGDKASVPHSHSYYQIIWFFEGAGTHTVDFEQFEIKERTVLFINKDQVHAFDENLEINGLLIHFNEGFFMHSDIDIFLKYNLFNSYKSPCYFIDKNISILGFSYVDLIRTELVKRDQFGTEDVIRYLLKSFLINLERVNRKDTEKNIEFTSQYEFQFYKFKDLLEENYRRNISVKGFADALNISSKTLSTITKRFVNKSPKQLITERIVLEAKRLIRYSSLQISEIAFQLGFDDASYFVKYFRRQVGISPTEYREKVKIKKATH